jgi:hypothetical protein
VAVEVGPDMSTFAQEVRHHVPTTLPAAEVDAALSELGPQRLLDTTALARADRAAMIDRFARNLRRLSSEDQVKIERTLLRALDCQPEGQWSKNLDTAVALIELRGHMKHSLAVLGIDWMSLSRLQSLVGGVARWLQGAGTATMNMHSSSELVEFVLATKDSGLTPDLVGASPMVQMLRSHLAELTVRETDEQVEIVFRIERNRSEKPHDHAA